MAPTLYYTDHHVITLPSTHKFPMAKYALVRELLASDGIYRFAPAPEADAQTVELAHDSSYVHGFLAGTLPTSVMRRIGFPWSEVLVRRTMSSVGGTLAAAQDALSNGFGGTLAGGTHHAFRAEGSGFCVFNDIAVAICSLRESHRKANGLHPFRAAVVDLDVHQGDGTALIFADDPDVLTVSLHGRNNFPFRKQRSKIDVELDDKTTDDEYLSALARTLPSIAEFLPEVIFYQSGVDPLFCDRLGRLALTHDGLICRDRMVFELCRSLGTPAVVTMGGGYGHPIEQTALAHANTYRIAAEVFLFNNGSGSQK